MQKRLLLVVLLGWEIGYTAISSINEFKRLKAFNKVINNGRSIKRFWAKLSKKYNVPIDIMGTDAIPSFEFLKSYKK